MTRNYRDEVRDELRADEAYISPSGERIRRDVFLWRLRQEVKALNRVPRGSKLRKPRREDFDGA